MEQLSDAVLPPGFTAEVIPIEVERARSILARGRSDLLFLERSSGSIVALTDSDGDDIPDASTIIAEADGLNHGLAVYDGYMYASTITTVYRWPFDESDLETPVDDTLRETVIENMADEGHQTRTLAFDEESGLFYVSIGSKNNVDPDSSRAQIRRFNLSEAVLPIDFATGEVFADGVRNEVGLAFDRFGILWGVENGADKLKREDLGGEIYEDNPAEEMHRFTEETAGEHWGYPYCWTEYALPEEYGQGRGSIWAWPTFMEEYTDEWCRQNTLPATLAMQAHSAPLGITFYDKEVGMGNSSDCTDGAFPEEMDGYAFIAFHGSWNRDVPTGYKVVYVPMEEGLPIADPIDLLAHIPPNAKWDDGFRPVDVSFDDCGRLLVTSDGSRFDGGRQGSKIVRISYNSTYEDFDPVMDRSGGAFGISGQTSSAIGLQTTNIFVFTLMLIVTLTNWRRT